MPSRASPSNNLIKKNAGGILLTDENNSNHDNLVDGKRCRGQHSRLRHYAAIASSRRKQPEHWRRFLRGFSRHCDGMISIFSLCARNSVPMPRATECSERSFGGAVGVASTESEGTTFTVRLPRVPLSNVTSGATTPER